VKNVVGLSGIVCVALTSYKCFFVNFSCGYFVLKRCDDISVKFDLWSVSDMTYYVPDGMFNLTYRTYLLI